VKAKKEEGVEDLKSTCLHWTDQPKTLDGLVVLFRTFVKGRIIEVRRGTNCYYVTTGNLFGSQTIRAASAEAAFTVMHLAASFDDGQPMDLPDDCKLVTD
jgi:hypothetical protein